MDLQDRISLKPGGDREMVDTLALVLLDHEQSVELSPAEGMATKTDWLDRARTA